MLDAVRARLGYDPFREPGEITILARIWREGEELRGSILLTDRSRQTGERTMVSHSADCSELTSAMDLALSIAIDPLSIGHEPVASPAVVELRMVPPPIPPVVERPASAPPAPTHFEINLGAAGNVGETVAATMGFLAGVGLRSERWSLSVEGRADLPRTRAAGGGHVEAGTLAATLAPCLRRGVFGGCVLATLAALRGAGQDLQNENQITTPFVALGARALVEFPQNGLIAVRLHLDLTSPLTRTTLKVGDQAVWTSPAMCVALGVAATVRFR